VSTTDDAEYARLGARAEQGFTVTGSTVGIDDGPGTASADGSAPPPMPWPYGPFLTPVPPRPAVSDEASASRGHPGDPGFAGGHDALTASADGSAWSVWQHAQRAWHAAGAEWSAAVVTSDIAAPSQQTAPSAPSYDVFAVAPKKNRPAPVYEMAPPAPAYSPPVPAREALPHDTLPPGPNGTAPASLASQPTPDSQPSPVGPSTASPSTASPFAASPSTASPSTASPSTASPSTASPALPSPAAPRWRTWERTPRRGILLAVVAALVLVAAGSGYAVLHSGLPARDYPAARLAGTVLGGDAIQPGQGITQTMGRVASYGGTAVAVGSQAGGDIPRAQFFVSHDDGQTWGLAAVTAPGGGAPSPGHAAQLVAHGPNGWLAVGPDAIWTSATGQSWTLTSAAGIVPSDAGDQPSVLTATGSGFLAAGQNPAEGTAVIWTSPDGRHWQRMTAAQLRLPAGGHTVADLTGAAVHGRDILLAGHVMPPAGGRVAATWLSTDNGQTWKWAPVPVSHGATSALAGVAASGAGFVAIRPGSSSPGRSSPGSSAAAQANGVVYVSADGISWRYAATLTATNGVQLGMVQAGPGGFVALGRGPAGAMGGYVSPNGLSWGSVIPFGPAPSSVTGATVTAGGTVVVTGSTGALGRQQPYLALAPVGQVAQTVNVASIPGGTISQLSADAVAISGNRRVAVGEAGGSPAIWTATGSSWYRDTVALTPAPAATSPASGASPAFTTPPVSSATPAADAQKLTSVVHGPAGWLATGEVVSATAQRPILLTSADGMIWSETGQDAAAFAGAHVVAAQATAGPAGYVVAGDVTTSAGTFPAAWWSRDLRTWTRAGGSASGGAAGDDPGEMAGVTAGPAGYVAVGTQGISPAVWTSSDGRTWHMTTLRVPDGAASASLRQVAVSGPHRIALGEERWSSGAESAFAEVSANGGRTWRPVALPSPHGDAIATALTPMRGGFTAVGTYGTPGHRNVVVWASPDGGAWTIQIPNGPGLSGPGIHEITSVTASGDGSLTGVGFTASASGEQPTLWNVPAR
jgi:hypothetical protein